jgi:hypothetical protein
VRVQRDALRVGPEIEVPADKFGALIDPDRLRIAGRDKNPFQRRDDVFGPIAARFICPSFKDRTLNPRGRKSQWQVTT